jgi:hypothetical protein
LPSSLVFIPDVSIRIRFSCLLKWKTFNIILDTTTKMGGKYVVYFKNENSEIIDSLSIDRTFTCWPSTLNEFWLKICYKTYEKRVFIDKLQTEMNDFDVDSEEFEKLVQILSEIVSSREFKFAYSIDIGYD